MYVYTFFLLQEDEAGVQSRAREVLEQIVDDVLLNAGQINEVLARLVIKLVEELPFDYIMQTESIEHIVCKIKEITLTGVDKKVLMESVQSITSVQRDETNIILHEILERVFGEGIDYLCFIHNQ